MLRVYTSNALDQLRDILVEMIRRQPLADPFEAERILVQSPGMAQWLKLELAERTGVAANVEFPLPASFLWQAFADSLEDVPERSSYAKNSLTWSLMRLLPDYLELPEFAPLKGYLEDDPSELRHFQLCAKVADLYDQYLVYRPEWINSWELGENWPADEYQQHWQPILWRVLVEDAKRRDQPHWHRANMFEAFVRALSTRGPAELPERLFVFGISALPENFLAALKALGEHCDIHLMVANPCRHYWSDIVDKRQLGRMARRQPEALLQSFEQGQPLLASMGKLGRDYFHLLQNQQLQEVQLFTDDDYSCLLHAVQSDILSLIDRPASLDPLADTSANKLCIANNDDSLQLHVCHSPMREVQVLHDRLLDLFERNRSLTPRDIIVMVPDVAQYTPYIDAVFGQSEVALPYSISDRSAQQESPLLEHLLGLLALERSRLGVGEVLDWLALPACLSKLGISEQAFEQLRHWVLACHVSWGLDEQSRSDLELPAFGQNSWQFGLDRLFSGYAMGDELWRGNLGYADVEGLETESLGPLAGFIDTLFWLRQTLGQSWLIADWIGIIHQLIERCYTPEDRDLVDLQLVYAALDNLQSTLQEVEYLQPIDSRILHQVLSEQLTGQRSSQRFLTGQINFCTLMPMRAIPFPVVCLLGMNDGDYPRAMPPMGFDLMAEAKLAKKGDRSRRDDDRYLFLEALLAARETLYISYVGRSIQDNSARAPSVLVSELLEYCEQSYCREGDQTLAAELSAERLSQSIRVEHPLTPHHPRYFDNSDKRLYSFSNRWLNVCQHLAGELPSISFLKPLTAWDEPEVELAQLRRFFADPCRAFFEQRLQVSFRQLRIQLDEEEPFDLDGLANYKMRDELLQQALKQQDLTAESERYLASGLLPIARAGEKVLAKNRRDAEELAAKVAPLLSGEPRRIALNLSLEQGELSGWVAPVYEAGVVLYSAGNTSGKRYFDAWILHLAACAQGLARPSYYRAVNQAFRYSPVPMELAKDQLDSLLLVFRQGMASPLAWLPELGWQLAQQEPENKIALAFERLENPYLSRVYPDWKSFSLGFSRLNEPLWTLLLAHLEILGDDDE